MDTRIFTLLILCLLTASACKDGNNVTNDSPPDPDNRPPEAFSLTSPEADADSTEIRLTFSWEAAADPDGDPVQYDVLLDTMPDPGTVAASGLTESEFTPDDRLSLVTDYYWKVVAKDGQGGETESDVFAFSTRALKDAELATDNAAFTPRDKHSSVVFDNKLWVAAGFLAADFGNDLWSSQDGITWQEAASVSTERFTRRFFHASTAFDDKMWVIGGVVDGGSFGNDVWVSDDGATWTELTQTNAITERAEHTATAFDNRLWVIGGSTTGGVKLNDVWSSSDGTDWRLETATADFSSRNFHQTVAFKGALWVIGGFDDTGAQNDIWRSEDGITWTEVTPQADFSARGGHRVSVFDDKLWLAGSGSTNDVWYSEDGETWKEITPANSYPARGEFTSLIFDEKLWVIAGGARNDVWYFDLN